MVNKGLRCLKKDKCLKFENFERKIKSPFMINADFESILVPENNEKQNPKESDTSKYQKHSFWSYDYKSVYADENCSKPFKSYLGKMLFKISLIWWLKKVNTSLIWWKIILTKKLIK